MISWRWQDEIVKFTLANIAHGYAEARLVTQIRQITFLARPTPVLEFRVSGWQMAWYLPHTSIVEIIFGCESRPNKL